MKPENIVNALNDMDYDMIEEAEMEKKILIPRLRGKKTVLIAAAVCLLLCDPRDGSPPVSSVHGIIQARILKYIAILFSRGSS